MQKLSIALPGGAAAIVTVVVGMVAAGHAMALAVIGQLLSRAQPTEPSAEGTLDALLLPAFALLITVPVLCLTSFVALLLIPRAQQTNRFRLAVPVVLASLIYVLALLT